MRLPGVFLTVLLSVVVLPVYAEEPKEIGLDQKLQRLYELYRTGETVSLKPHEFRFDLGVAYAFHDKSELGL
ncbi:MAG: hypothetical protein U1A23_03940, partial [Candidatus Sungbacteria bacterium]|nr:hypothetical protein [Candidatus Sungbacteria bacterium]